MDVASASVVGRIDLGPNSRPRTALFLPDGRRAVATMQDSDQLALIDLDTMAVMRTYPTGGREGHMVRLSPDGARAYVTSRDAEGTLSVIFLNEERAPVVIETGRGAEGLDVTADGREVWVANRSETSIAVVDTESFEVVATLDSRPFAGRIEMGPDGRLHDRIGRRLLRRFAGTAGRGSGRFGQPRNDEPTVRVAAAEGLRQQRTA